MREDILEAMKDVFQDIDVTLDTEDMGDHLFVFDVLRWKGKDLSGESFASRSKILDIIKMISEEKGKSEIIRVDTPVTLYNNQEIHAFIDEKKKDNEEGVVLRNPDATYVAGRPASGGNAIKIKFIESATVRTKSIVTEKRSVTMEVLQGTEWKAVGSVTIPSNADIPKPGSLIEVAYLYAYKEGSLFQPVYKGKRTDLDESSATITQLKYKKKK